MHHPEETAQPLQKHADGLTWVYTGDLGTMDEQGFVYFKGRAKRMIVSSGYNVYPAQIENILDAHEYVQMRCVIGVPDSYKMQKVKAFVKLAAGVEANDATKQAILDHCRKHVAKYFKGVASKEATSVFYVSKYFPQRGCSFENNCV